MTTNGNGSGARGAGADRTSGDAPLLPDQPDDAERPMPLRAAPERTNDPRDWDVRTDETARPRSPQDAGEPVPDTGVDLRHHAPDGVEEQSSYSTDLSQGAVHPQGSDDADRDDAEPEAQSSS